MHYALHIQLCVGMVYRMAVFTCFFHEHILSSLCYLETGLCSNQYESQTKNVFNEENTLINLLLKKKITNREFYHFPPFTPDSYEIEKKIIFVRKGKFARFFIVRSVNKGEGCNQRNTRGLSQNKTQEFR
jgi:hypothetical protein